METAAPTDIGNGGKGKSTPKSILSGSTPQARWKAAHPKETWAHAALRSALKKGLIEKEPCGVCGAHEVDGHHDDYNRPMDVRWFCRRHHKQEHRRLKCEAING
ncbi:hypothetical protein [Mesorhizobium sp.]|uniref:hypothetical protein n=1 Tax=Mesorhizobium sp. TaxID=1871066 RepID=UPI00257B88B3|nr:hypothetical protein [Mesorhizobium sp.]